MLISKQQNLVYNQNWAILGANQDPIKYRIWQTDEEMIYSLKLEISCDYQQVIPLSFSLWNNKIHIFYFMSYSPTTFKSI